MKNDEKIVCRPIIKRVIARIDSLILAKVPKCLKNHSIKIKRLMENPAINNTAPTISPFSKLKCL